MSLRRFLTALFRGGSAKRRRTHSGDNLAEEIRDATGPLAGGADGGRLTGGGVYRDLEDRDRP